MATTSVLYVHRRNAKKLKSRLEKESLLDKRFRMIPSASDAAVVLENSQLTDDSAVDVDAIVSGNCIAVPVTDECVDRFETHSKENSNTDIPGDGDSWETYAIAHGRQQCPFSSSAMGNQNQAMVSRILQQNDDRIIEKSKENNNAAAKVLNLTNIQCVVVETLVDSYSENTKKSDNSLDQKELASFQAMVKTKVSSLSIKPCPKKLEVMGDDRTLVVPSTAFLLQEEEATNDFHRLLIDIVSQIHNDCPDRTDHPAIWKIQENLWKNLASLYKSPRVVRRGDIDPESGVRESGHRILWPPPASITSSNNDAAKCANHGYTPKSTGPDSPGWITVTEHKIRQSLDLTRVMFSRGNVTEKKRFGLLVQPDEYVLDMYAGIGYYTLPALVHGRARHVTACEWNPNAVFALRHNLKANKVDERATVLEGDCRLTLQALMGNQKDGNVHYFDRISLGLLPSSEGGWPIAIECLNREKGGWLHVHGNVATAERQQWAHWLCRSLVCISKKNEYSTDWHAVCNHIERVKSFAPKVDHYVADVFVGPLNSPSLFEKGVDDDVTANNTGVLDSGVFTATPMDVCTPSCALNTDGVIHQKWMM